MQTIVIDEKTVSVDGVKYAKVEEPKPEFKVGDWVISLNENRSDCIFRISEINNRGLFGTDFNQPSDNYGSWQLNAVRLAKENEIENHLLKTAKQKGLVNGVRFIQIDSSKIRTLERSGSWRYSYQIDALLSCTPTNEWKLGQSNPAIYEQGKWAEIIPEKKKQLPKTKEGFIDFLKTWEFAPEFYDTESLMQLLNDYED